MALFRFIREGVNTWGGCPAGRPRRHAHNASDQIELMPTSLWIAPASQAPSRNIHSNSAFPSALPIIDEPDLTPITTMANRFGPSTLHQRDPRSALFEGYEPRGSGRLGSNSPSRATQNRGFEYGGNGGVERVSYRPATPNSR